MLAWFNSRILFYLLQFESFPDTIRFYINKYSQDKVMIMAYAGGAIVIVVILYRILAREKRRR